MLKEGRVLTPSGLYVFLYAHDGTYRIMSYGGSAQCAVCILANARHSQTQIDAEKENKTYKPAICNLLTTVLRSHVSYHDMYLICRHNVVAENNINSYDIFILRHCVACYILLASRFALV